MDKHTIYKQVEDLLIQKFDLPNEKIHPKAHLVDDLQLDSIDAVDMMVQLKPYFGSVHPEAFRAARTVGDVVDALHDLSIQQENKNDHASKQS